MDTTLADPLVGRELDGRYLVRSRIARGGMATVYLALDQRLDREVALKVMHAHLADDPQFTARFIREARAAARLSHPNVVQVFDQAAEGELLYLAMEYLRGRTLREVLSERRVLTPREALTVIEPVLDALAAAHRLGIVHRDVKPENVVLTDDGRVKVADFGLARAATTNTSTSGVLLGTVGYLAPELVVRGVADARSDVYAAGIVLFEMLTGRPPFSGPMPIQVAYRHVNEQVPAPSTYVPQLPPDLDAVVAAATARDPADRPEDAAELLARLRAVHARLTPDQLDLRPDPPPLHEGGPPPGAETEVFDAPPAPQVTRALPELGGPLQRLRASVGAVPAGAAAAALEDDAALVSLLRRRRLIGLSALLTVIALALGLAGVAWYVSAGPGAYTATPDVVGLRVADATARLRAEGLRSRQVPVFDPVAASGVVVATDPGAGHDVRKDGVVEVQVSQGPEFVVVPPVVGQQEDAARQALAAGHLTAGDSVEQYSDEPRGQVLAVSPEVGKQVRNGSTVTLTVSKGPKPVDVPGLVGKTREDAEAILRDLHLVAAYGPEQNSSDVPQGSIISQTPSDGQLVPPGTVTLVVSKGPVLAKVPNVVGKQFNEAKQILLAAGFQVRRATLLGGYFGTVRLQVPGANGMAPKGSTIVLTVV